MTEEAFDALPPTPQKLIVAGQTLEITPLKVGELPGFARAIRPIADQLVNQALQEPDWLQILCDHGDSLVQALAIATRMSVSWVRDLAPDDAIELAEAVFAANADFFIQRVVPRITQAAQRLPTRIHGATPSPGSSAQALPTATS